jgi:hypothetical protein
MRFSPAWALLLCAALAWPAPAMAEDFVATSGQLSDDAFYRLVACAAPPDAPCAKPLLRWPVTRPLRVQLAQIDRAFLGGKQNRARAALERALQFLNASGMGLQLTEVPKGAEDADIRIYFLDTDGSAPLANTGIEGADGLTVTGARVIVWSDRDSGTIRRATILFGTQLSIRHYESAMLEELTQSLGLLTDIRNPAYEETSVFSQDSNAAKRLGPQDIMALRRHYPPITE